MGALEDSIKECLALTGVDKWHAAGYTGEGVVIWNCEDEGSEHSNITYKCLSIVAPKATILRASHSTVADSGGYTVHQVQDDGVYYDIEDYIRANNVKVITYSMQGSSSPNANVEKYWQTLQEKYGLIIFNSGGNDGINDLVGSPFGFDVSIQVGAVNENLTRASYSSTGPNLDFMGLTFVWSGTSFSCPFIAAIAALIISRYGLWMDDDDVYTYLTAVSKDLGAPGKDNLYGWGFPIMPEPTKKYITLQIGSNIMTVDGQAVEMDTCPVIDKNNRTLTPIRAPMEALGHTVGWDNINRKVIIIE